MGQTRGVLWGYAGFGVYRHIFDIEILNKGEEMAAKFGVNITVLAEAARPISVESTTPIGIAGYEEVLENGLHFYMTTDLRGKKEGERAI